jgi:hypothetical protein
MLDAGAAVSLAALSPAAPALANEAAPVPESGVWLAQEDSGLRFFVDVRGGQPQLVGQFFDVSGQPQWAQARLGHDADQVAYLGRWTRHRDGSAWDGGSRPARPDQDLGAVRLSQGADGRWLLDSGGRRLTLRRADLADAGPARNGGPGRTGLWWSVDRLGALAAIDARGTRARLSVLAYTHGGGATWRTAELSQQTDGRYSGTWVAWSGGSTLAGPGRAALAHVSDEVVDLYWDGSDRARLVLAGGQAIALQAGPDSTGTAPRAQSEALLGIWLAHYTAGAAWTERWTLGGLSPSTLNVGDYNVSGFNQWGGWMLGGWSSRYANHSVYAPGLLLDDFYVFQPSGDGGWQGCYHYYQLATDHLSACHPLAVSRSGTASEAAAAPGLGAGALVGDRGKESVVLATTPLLAQSVAGVAEGPGLPTRPQGRAQALLQQWRQAAMAR